MKLIAAWYPADAVEAVTQLCPVIDCSCVISTGTVEPAAVSAAFTLATSLGFKRLSHETLFAFAVAVEKAACPFATTWFIA